MGVILGWNKTKNARCKECAATCDRATGASCESGNLQLLASQFLDFGNHIHFFALRWLWWFSCSALFRRRGLMFRL